MTLLDVLKLARHYIKMVAIVVVACTLAGIGLGVAKAGLGNAEYSAEAVLTISEPTATVVAGELMPLAKAVAENVLSEGSIDGVALALKYDISTRSIAFAAVASSEAESIEAANNAARQTADETATLLQEMADKYRSEISAEEVQREGNETITFGLSERNRAAALEMVSFTVNDASESVSDSGASAIAKFALVGLCGGVFLAICLVLILNILNAPIKDYADLQNSASVPVIAVSSEADFASKLWANILFSGEGSPRSVCLVPIGEPVAQTIKAVLLDIDEGLVAKDRCEGVSIRACRPIRDSAEALYVAHDSSRTILCATEWADTKRQVSYTIGELKRVGANVCGIVLVSN